MEEKKKIIQRVYKKEPTSLLVFGFFLLLTSVVILIAVSNVNDKFKQMNDSYTGDSDLNEIKSVGVSQLIAGAVIILFYIAAKYSRDNYTEVELEGKVIPPIKQDEKKAK